jgi:hypothetical protein
LPEPDAVRGQLDVMVEALSAMLTGTRLEDDLADLLWSFVNLFHRKTDRVERELDLNEQAQRRGQTEQDGSEVKSVALPQKWNSNTKERGIALTLRAVRKPAENRQCRVSTLAETFGAGKAVLIPVAYVQVPGARGGVVADLTATYSVEELINSVEIHEE